jgi:hypothetical protein
MHLSRASFSLLHFSSLQRTISGTPPQHASSLPVSRPHSCRATHQPRSMPNLSHATAVGDRGGCAFWHVRIRAATGTHAGNAESTVIRKTPAWLSGEVAALSSSETIGITMRRCTIDCDHVMMSPIYNWPGELYLLWRRLQRLMSGQCPAVYDRLVGDDIRGRCD